MEPLKTTAVLMPGQMWCCKGFSKLSLSGTWFHEMCFKKRFCVFGEIPHWIKSQKDDRAPLHQQDAVPTVEESGNCNTDETLFVRDANEIHGASANMSAGTREVVLRNVADVAASV